MDTGKGDELAAETNTAQKATDETLLAVAQTAAAPSEAGPAASPCLSRRGSFSARLRLAQVPSEMRGGGFGGAAVISGMLKRTFQVRDLRVLKLGLLGFFRVCAS